MKKIRVLLVTDVVTGEHDYRTTNERLRTLLESTGHFEVHISEAFAGSTAAVLDKSLRQGSCVCHFTGA